MRAYLATKKVKLLLDGRPIKFLSDRMNEMGIKMDYNNFLQLYHNRSNWLLLYGLAVAKILNVSIEDIFYIE